MLSNILQWLHLNANNKCKFCCFDYLLSTQKGLASNCWILKVKTDTIKVYPDWSQWLHAVSNEIGAMISFADVAGQLQCGFKCAQWMGRKPNGWIPYPNLQRWMSYVSKSWSCSRWSRRGRGYSTVASRYGSNLKNECTDTSRKI